MRRIAKFEKKLLGLNEPIITELEGGNVLTSITWKAGGTYDASGEGSLATDGMFNWMGRLELKVGSRSVVNMLGPDWRHLSSFIQGGYGEITPAIPIATGDKIAVCHGHIPFNKLLSRAFINGRSEKVTLQTKLGRDVDFGTTITDVIGEFDAHGYTTDDLDERELWFEPDVRTIEVPLQSTRQNGKPIEFTEPEIILGVMFRQQDHSLALTDPNLSRPDHLVRRVSIQRQKTGRGREALMDDMSWSQLKQKSVQDFGILATTGQLHKGVAMYQFDDPNTPGLETAVFARGDQLHVVLDSQSDIDPDLALSALSALDPGNDKCFVTVIGMKPRGEEFKRDPRGTFAKYGIRWF